MTEPNLLASKGSGGDSGATSPTSTPDNLRSADTVEVILALGEGPWWGLEFGKQSFNVGATALQNGDGTFNFNPFTFNFFPGTPTDPIITPVLGGTSNNGPVGVALSSGVPVVRTTSSGNINFIDHRMSVERLMKATTSGTFNASVTYRIEYKLSSSSTWIKAFGQDITISGKTTSTYVKETRIPVTPTLTDTYDIRTTKISTDDTTTYFADLSWESFQETVSGTMTFPNTVCIQIVAAATDQFTQIPTWSGVYKGLLIKVPTNYNPVTRTYTGMWDGSWQVAWTDNPAWCLYDFVMNDRYGIASYYPNINLNKYDCYTAAQWCDQMVSNGQGGLQPRYTYNDYVTEARPGMEMARYIAGVFNATFFDDRNGTAYLLVDKDDTAAHVFGKENVYEPGFQYTYTDITTRYNNITVSFDNPDLQWATDRRRIADAALMSANGNIPLDYIAVGCINAHEALRRTEYKLITANTENCICTFKTNRLGMFVKVFEVILVCDPDMGYGISGRFKSIANDGLSATLRTPVYLEAGINYTIKVTLNDNSTYESVLINTNAGYNSTLYFNGPIPISGTDAAPDKAFFTLEFEGKIGLPRPFRVTSVEETDGNPDMYTITGININRNKWYDSDNLVDTGVVDYSSLPSPLNPPGPTFVGFSERYIEDQTQFEIIVSPVFDRGAYKYYSNDHSFEVWSRLTGTTDAFVKRDVILGDTLINHPIGAYDFKILGRSYLGLTTPLATAPVWHFTVENPKDPPHDVDWLLVNETEYYWGYTNPPVDFAGFILRYQNVANRITWDDAIQPHIGILTPTSFTTKLIPASARVIMVRAVDKFGIPSANSAIIYRALGDVSVDNILDTVHFTLSHGTPTGGTYVSGFGIEADDTSGAEYTGIPTNPMYDGGNFYETQYQELIYQDDFTPGTAGLGVVRLGFAGAGYELSMRPHSTNPADPWQPVPDHVPLDTVHYDIRVRIFGGSVRGEITSLDIDIDVPSIIEDIQDVTVGGTGLIRLPITKTYSAIKVVSVIIQNNGVSTAKTYRVLDKVTTIGAGPQIELLDGSGTRVAGLIDATIKGY